MDPSPGKGSDRADRVFSLILGHSPSEGNSVPMNLHRIKSAKILYPLCIPENL